jgi:hypothetical protein
VASSHRVVGDDLVLEVVECRLACCLCCLSPEKKATEKSTPLQRHARTRWQRRNRANGRMTASRAEGGRCDFASRSALLISPSLHCLGRVCSLVGNVRVRQEAGGVDHSHRTVLCLDLRAVRGGESGDGRQGKCCRVGRRRWLLRRSGSEGVTWSQRMCRVFVCSVQGHEGRMRWDAATKMVCIISTRTASETICPSTLPAFNFSSSLSGATMGGWKNLPGENCQKLRGLTGSRHRPRAAAFLESTTVHPPRRRVQPREGARPSSSPPPQTSRFWSLRARSVFQKRRARVS